MNPVPINPVPINPAPINAVPFSPAPFALGPALLFCPADRPDRFATALERADALVIDLEDGVAADRKDAARQAVTDHPVDADRTIVRVNPAGTPDHDADLAALARTGYRTLMLPKADGRFVGPLVRPDGTPYAVVALCETAAGVLAAAALAARPDVVALAWGADDLVASLGGTTSKFADGPYRDVARHARSAVLLAAGAAGKAAVDAVHLDFADLDGLRAEALDAAAVGFTASLCIHPSQVPVIRAAYSPSDDAIADARAVLAAAEASTGGVFALNGRMVDGPVLKQAHAILRRAGIRAGDIGQVHPVREVGQAHDVGQVPEAGEVGEISQVGHAGEAGGAGEVGKVKVGEMRAIAQRDKYRTARWRHNEGGVPG